MSLPSSLVPGLLQNEHTVEDQLLNTRHYARLMSEHQDLVHELKMKKLQHNAMHRTFNKILALLCASETPSNITLDVESSCIVLGQELPIQKKKFLTGIQLSNDIKHFANKTKSFAQQIKSFTTHIANRCKKNTHYTESIRELSPASITARAIYGVSSITNLISLNESVQLNMSAFPLTAPFTLCTTNVSHETKPKLNTTSTITSNIGAEKSTNSAAVPAIKAGSCKRGPKKKNSDGPSRSNRKRNRSKISNIAAAQYDEQDKAKKSRLENHSKVSHNESSPTHSHSHMNDRKSIATRIKQLIRESADNKVSISLLPNVFEYKFNAQIPYTSRLKNYLMSLTSFGIGMAKSESIGYYIVEIEPLTDDTQSTIKKASNSADHRKQSTSKTAALDPVPPRIVELPDSTPKNHRSSSSSSSCTKKAAHVSKSSNEEKLKSRSNSVSEQAHFGRLFDQGVRNSARYISWRSKKCMFARQGLCIFFNTKEGCLNKHRRCSYRHECFVCFSPSHGEYYCSKRYKN